MSGLAILRRCPQGKRHWWAACACPVPSRPSDQALASRFVTEALQALEQSHCDRGLMASAFFNLAGRLAVKDLSERPGMIGFYSRELREVVDRVMGSAHYVPDKSGRSH